MSNLITPARLAAALGVVTGLGAAVTSLLNVFPKDTAVGRTVVAASGVLATAGTLIKWLDGQSQWERQINEQDHYAAEQALADVKSLDAMVNDAELPGEDPLVDDVDSDEPVRLVNQQG